MFNENRLVPKLYTAGYTLVVDEQSCPNLMVEYISTSPEGVKKKVLDTGKRQGYDGFIADNLIRDLGWSIYELKPNLISEKAKTDTCSWVFVPNTTLRSDAKFKTECGKYMNVYPGRRAYNFCPICGSEITLPELWKKRQRTADCHT